MTVPPRFYYIPIGKGWQPQRGATPDRVLFALSLRREYNYKTANSPFGSMLMEKRYPPIFQSVPADEFTDREEIIEEMMHWASITPRDMMISTAVVGPRRIGKTAVLEQVYNRLFWEQDEVVPIYFSFEAKPTTSTEFAWAYFINFLQQYIAFRRKDDNLARLDAQEVEPRDLISMAEEMKGDPISVLAPGLFRLLNSPTALLHDKLERVIYLPRRVMEYNRARWKPETPIFVMLDEFQEVMKIRYSDGKPADGVGLYQWAVEGRQCPHIVTGSAVRLITQEILGTGALFGRFEYFPFPPLPNIYGLELVDKLAHKYGLEIPEPVAGYIVTRCGGNPFYIRCVIMRAIRQRLSTVKDKTVVDDLIAYEVTRGLIWRDWSGQLQKYFEQINSQYIAKHILFYAAQFEDEMIDIEVIAKKVNRPPDEVYHILRQLAFAEMIDVRGGVVFFNLKDPILRDFIRAQYELDIEKKPVERKQEELVEEYRRLKGKYADLVGALVEARVEALLNRFDGREVEGRLFHAGGKVRLPRFRYVADTVVKPLGKREYQIDLVGEWNEGYDFYDWVVEIKHWKRKVTREVVEGFEEACRALVEERRLAGVVKWLVSSGGFTEGAVEAMEGYGMYYSGREELNELLHIFGVERMPEHL